MFTRDTIASTLRITTAVIVLLALWEFFVRITHTASYVLPAPSAIATQLWLKAPLLFASLGVTIGESLVGLAIAIVFAFVFAILVVYSRIIRDSVYPMLVALQAAPKVALAPLCIAWFGLGAEPKFVLAALLCFFPLLIAAITGLGSVDQDMLDLARSNDASAFKVLVLVRIPRCLPYFMDGLKVALPNSVIGAIVGEFVAGQQGIGVLIGQASLALEVPLTFAGILAISVATTLLYGLLLLCEFSLLRWHRLELGHT